MSDQKFPISIPLFVGGAFLLFGYPAAALGVAIATTVIKLKEHFRDAGKETTLRCCAEEGKRMQTASKLKSILRPRR